MATQRLTAAIHNICTSIICSSALVLTVTASQALAEDIDGTDEIVNGSGDGTSGTINNPWHVGDDLRIGVNTDGSLSIEEDGFVSANTVNLGTHAGATGTLNIERGVLTSSRGVLEAAAISKGDGDAAITIDGGILRATRNEPDFLRNFDTGDITFEGTWGPVIDSNNFDIGIDSDLEGTGLQKEGDGTLTLSGNSSLSILRAHQGTLRLDDAQLDSFSASIGAQLDVTGSNSTWTLRSGLGVGGTFNIEDGAQVVSGSGAIGRGVPSREPVGRVRVAGTGSEWDLTVSSGSPEPNELRVAGNLIIEDGGQVTSPVVRIALVGDPSGTVTVTGDGSLLKNDVFFYVGERNKGTVNIEDGGRIDSNSSYIGYEAGSSGTLTVSGANSIWSAPFPDIGHQGEGTLIVLDGGIVDSRAPWCSNCSTDVGYEAGSSGAVTVSGTNSVWKLDGLFLGNQGEGALTVSDSGSVVMGHKLTMGYREGSVGTLILKNNSSARGVLETGYIEKGEGSASITFDGGILRARHDEPDFLRNFDAGDIVLEGSGAIIDSNGFDIGINSPISASKYSSFRKQGDGTLTLSANIELSGLRVEQGTLHLDNIQINSRDARVAAGTQLDVTGSDLRWQNAFGLQVSGTLNIENGAQVRSRGGRLDSFSSLNTDNLPTVTVTGAGSIWRGTNNTIRVGGWAPGILNIEDGGQVIVVNDIVLGGFSSGSGTLNVTGAGSTLTTRNLGSLIVGDVNTGSTVNIEDGGHIATSGGVISGSTGSSGAVTVQGAGSRWDLRTLRIGNNGKLTIADGGIVDATMDVNVGDSEVLVTGPGSRFIIGRRFNVGADYLYNGEPDRPQPRGVLTASDGGVIESHGPISVGRTGKVLITGPGSEWTIGGDLFLGGGSGHSWPDNGSLTIEDGGIVSANMISMTTYNEQAVGSLFLEGDGGARGVLETGYIIKDRGDPDIDEGPGTADIIFDGGILRASSDEADFLRNFAAGDVTIDAGGAYIDSNGHNIAIATSLQGDGDLVKVGDGTLVLKRQNAYRNTLVEAGTLRGNINSISGNIANAATVVFNQVGRNTFSGDIAGLNGTHGQMVKQGTGTLELTGNAILDWRVKDGTLLSSADRFTGHVDIAQNAALNFHETANNTYAGTLSGSGDFLKTGDAALTMTGHSAGFAGITDVQAGLLTVNGSLGGNINVSGGTLGGNGTVGTTTVSAGGTIAPGNSVGMLNVLGDITFEEGATYEIEADPRGAGDLIHVSGQAFLEGGSAMHIGENGPYLPYQTYTILTAGGGVNGTFDNVSSRYAFLRPSLTYTPHSVYLELIRNHVAFCMGRSTGNQCNVGSGVESIGSGTSLYDAVLGLNANEATAAFDSLSGEMHASLKSSMLEDSRFVRDASLDRLRGGFGGMARNTQGFDSWSRALGSWGEWESHGNAAGLERSTDGFFMGTDGMVNKNWRMGMIGGYSRSSVEMEDRASSGEDEAYHLGLFGGRQWGRLGLRLGAAHSWHDVEDLNRHIAFQDFSDSTSTSYGARTEQAFVELGYQMGSPALAFEPFVNLTHVNVHTDGFEENGGAAALSGISETSELTLATVGLNLSSGFQLGQTVITTRSMLGLRHASGDTSPTSTLAFAGGNSFAVAGTPIARDTAVVQLGADMNISDNSLLGFSYNGLISSDVSDHGVRADFTMRF